MAVIFFSNVPLVFINITILKLWRDVYHTPKVHLFLLDLFVVRAMPLIGMKLAGCE